MTIIFYILSVLWVIALGTWLYTIISKKMREKKAYLYSALAVCIVNIGVQICNFIIQSGK